MSQEVPLGDIIFGAIVLIIFLIGALVAGRFLSSIKNRRFAKAWAPLVPLINGTISHDGGGAASSYLSGTYQGRRVQASMIPDRNRYQGETGERYNYFDVALADIAGSEDWRMEYKSPVLGLGKTGWDVAAVNEALEVRLNTPTILATLSQLGYPTIEFKARERTLRYSQDITPLWVLTPERFLEALGILRKLAAVQEGVNAG